MSEQGEGEWVCLCRGRVSGCLSKGSRVSPRIRRIRESVRSELADIWYFVLDY